MKYLVLDFGDVIFKTRMREMYEDVFRSNRRDVKQVDFFLSEIFTKAHQAKTCLYDDMRVITEPLVEKFPDWKAEIEAALPEREYLKVIKEPIDGTVELMHQAKDDGFGIYGITNWPGDGFEALRRGYPDIIGLFDDVVVSGKIGVRKPDADIFEYAAKIMGNPHPSQVYYFDDKQKNVDAVKSIMGWNAFVFESPDTIAKATGLKIGNGTKRNTYRP